MHYSEIFTFVCTVVLGLVTLSSAIPVNDHAAALQSVSIPSIYNVSLTTPSSPSNKLTTRQSDWVMELYWQSVNGDYVPMPICSTNYGDHGMCNVGYFTSTYMNSATLWMWDNTCSQIGYEESISYSGLYNGIFFHSSLPQVLVLHLSGGYQNGDDLIDNLVYWWPVGDPEFANWRITHADHEFFSWVMPFSCH